MDRTRSLVQSAATFFIEQVLFAPDADAYRVLGANPQASAGELRRNVALLLRWLHPDLDPRGQRAIFVGRVTAAWNDLKTPDRRTAYDQSLQRVSDKRRTKSKANGRGDGKHVAIRNGRGYRLRRRRIGLLRRVLSVLFRPQEN